jgi:hypothetical protein
MLIPDPTDNLILHSILDHARRFPGAAKALLTYLAQLALPTFKILWRF